MTPLFEKTICIALDGLQYAHDAYRFEEHTVVDVCNWLTEMNVTLILIHHPAKDRTPIFFSKQILYSVQKVTNIDDLNQALSWLKVTEQSLYQKILHTLEANPKQYTL